MLLAAVTACNTAPELASPDPMEIPETLVISTGTVETPEATAASTVAATSTPRSCPQIDETTGAEIAVEPCPGDYLACDDLPPGMILEDVTVETSTCEQDYFSLREGIGNVQAGDACLSIHGRIKNERSQSYYVGVWAQGDDSMGNTVSWTLDCAHICGAGLVSIGGRGADTFTLHLNVADNITSIKIQTGCYSTPPP